jgi:hypothetical protein
MPAFALVRNPESGETSATVLCDPRRSHAVPLWENFADAGSLVSSLQRYAHLERVPLPDSRAAVVRYRLEEATSVPLAGDVLELDFAPAGPCRVCYLRRGPRDEQTTWEATDLVLAETLPPELLRPDVPADVPVSDLSRPPTDELLGHLFRMLGPFVPAMRVFH